MIYELISLVDLIPKLLIYTQTGHKEEMQVQQ